MYATCDFVAPPAPDTTFFTVAGGNSTMASPARAPASKITPRAWARTTVVRTFLA